MTWLVGATYKHFSVKVWKKHSKFSKGQSVVALLLDDRKVYFIDANNTVS